jgi:pSer/pThr/pTyr-binding forkhead associated (FHA) protein
VDSIPEAVPVATPSPDAVSDSVAPVGATDGDDSVAVDEAQREVGNLELDATGGPSDVEKTRIVDRPARGDAFILQFSTGENITVAGTGLIGRNPLAEPGEYFDSLVSIVDPGKSVSKTHLEFGQDGGQFWISDRYSANGTVVREPDRPARRGEAGKRYRVVRGTRVDIGEQFFIVS